jgi:hypothetical protein
MAVPDRDKGNNFILQISLQAASPYCIVNWHICSNVLLPSSPLNLINFGILNHSGYMRYTHNSQDAVFDTIDS